MFVHWTRIFVLTPDIATQTVDIPSTVHITEVTSHTEGSSVSGDPADGYQHEVCSDNASSIGSEYVHVASAAGVASFSTDTAVNDHTPQQAAAEHSLAVPGEWELID